MKNRIYAIILGLFLVTAGCQSPQVLEEDLTPLTASGTILAQDLKLASATGGRIAALYVREGDVVQRGDVLVEMDTTPWELQLMPAEAAVTAAEAALDALLAGPRAEKIAAAEANVAWVEAKRDGAYAAWQHALELVENPQEIDRQIVEAQAQVALAEQGVELAEAQMQPVQINRDIRIQGSLERQVAQYQVNASEHALKAAQEDLMTAQTLLKYLWWIRNEPLGYIAQANGAEGQYLVAQQEVAVAEAQINDILDGPTAEEIAVAEAAIQQARAEANLLQMKIEQCTLTSPIDGVVIAQSLHIGELAAPAATIVRLADLSTVSLEVFVPENRVGHVQLDQAVSVRVDSFPDRTFTGRVIEIGDEPEFTPRNVATVEERLNTFYVVVIELPNEDGSLKPGMPADAVF